MRATLPPRYHGTGHGSGEFRAVPHDDRSARGLLTMSSARRSVLLLAVLAVLCGLLLWTTCGDERSTRGTPRAEQHSGNELEERSKPLANPESDPQSRSATTQPAVQQHQTSASARATIVVLDAAGVEYAHESGVIRAYGVARTSVTEACATPKGERVWCDTVRQDFFFLALPVRSRPRSTRTATITRTSQMPETWPPLCWTAKA